MTTPAGVLIDTSAWIEALRPSGDPATRAAVESAMRDGHASTCPLVMLELWNGASGTRETAFLHSLEEEVPSLAIDLPVWALARDLARACRARGISVPATDLVIAACATRHGAGLLHRDEHFTRIGSAAGR